MRAIVENRLLATIRDAWGWIGLEPAEITAENSFGNLIVRATDGAYWRICPEELSCQKIASDCGEFEAVLQDDGFQLDWQMARFFALAEQTLGPVHEGKCYCLKIPGVIGGKYEPENFGTISLEELISFSGDLAEQIKDVPDGEQIAIKLVR